MPFNPFSVSSIESEVCFFKSAGSPVEKLPAADTSGGGVFAATWVFWSAGFGLCRLGGGCGAGAGVVVAAGCVGCGTVITGGGRLVGALFGSGGGASSIGGARGG